MTLLVGNSTTTAFTTTAVYTNAGIWYMSFVASATGTANSIKAYLRNHDDGCNFKLCLWNSSGTLLASGSASVNNVAGWNTQTIADTAIIAGQTYYIGFLADAYLGGWSSNAVGSLRHAPNGYPTPSALTPGSDTSVADDFAIYADGTTGDTTPDAFSFTDQTNVAVSSTITSAAITVAGITAASAISVSGGSYEINNSGTWLTAASTVSNGDTVKARHTSSASYSTAVNTTVTIGGVSDTFTSTTVPPTTTSFSIGFRDNASAAVASTSLNWYLTSTWGGSVVNSGTDSTDASGNLTKAGLPQAAGSYLLFYKLASNEEHNGMGRVTLV